MDSWELGDGGHQEEQFRKWEQHIPKIQAIELFPAKDQPDHHLLFLIKVHLFLFVCLLPGSLEKR